MRRRAIPDGQTTFDAFMDKVEVTTDATEALIVGTAGHEGLMQFRAKPDMLGGAKVAERLTKTWAAIYHTGAKIDQFFDISLAVLERRESDYMRLIDGIKKKTLNAYASMFGDLVTYFIDGNYSDPLGTFYMENFSSRMGGEFYTPWNVAYMMAEILDPEPDETVLDPCIMLIAARCVIHQKYGWIASSRYGRNLYGADISSDAVKMSKINLFMTDYVYMMSLLVDGVREWINQTNHGHTTNELPKTTNLVGLDDKKQSGGRNDR
ncbi:MAG: N-6 DNA methylase [Nitrospiraceae bacterium]|nr:N-6 DNA methylase [Nitrospiraceae bacterium]